jgi:hypothetical protein
VEDLLRWNDFYLSGKFGSPSLFAKQTEIRPLNNGKRNGYAAGLSTDSIKGWRAISHTGATAGYRAQLEYFPDQGLSFAWLSNNASGMASSVPEEVRNVFIKNLSTPEAEDVKTDSTINWKNFLQHSGAYVNEKTGAGITLYGKENGLYMIPNGGPLPAVDENSLAVGRGRLIFDKTKTNELVFQTAAGNKLLFTKTDTARTDEKSLNEFAGVYYSEETESFMYAEVKNGKLIMYPRKGMEEEAAFTYRNGIYYPGAEMFFTRDKKNEVTGFYVTVARARKVAFKKVK